ncbi:protein-glutamate O-methyltransferase CheR [Hyphomicrobium sp.]|jgi:chemotaxis protein methyltransferase CheR|uniref:CheR family methyltransferase n=1 Tax=Hyphomicrobium sp. TaxID=82 RepID=UPI000FB9E67C|nr:protein-glutamate O-methyltransferase CheR [Hyphomicrobium sp.]RUO98741.1 MAG: protein-glutamate O-methyltransferase CheR [Hyphomicrobium sp.]
MTSAADSSASASGALLTGEFAFTDANFREIARIAKAEAGIDLPQSKATLVYSRLAKRLRALGIRSFSDYCTTVRENDDERNSMIAALTTNVTRFFREPHHFEHLRKSIIEPIAESARRGNRVRLWSAACSTGQEPYSMALTVLSVIPEAASLDVRILATDLNPHVVAHGRRGCYQKEEVADVPAGLRSSWFGPDPENPGGSTLRVDDDVRSLISFQELNLMGAWRFKGPFDAIFCRNVVIYFDRETQNTVWSRLTSLLKENGALYIGHSERVAGQATALLTTDGITTYRKKNGRPS